MGLRLGIETQRVDRVAAELLVVTCFIEDRPLRGDAGRCDWRLRGMLSRLCETEQLGRMEATLVPSGGHLQAPRLMIMGLGSRQGFCIERIREVAHETVERALDLGVSSVVRSSPGHWLETVPAGFAAEAMAIGAAMALVPKGRRGILGSLRLLVPGAHAERASKGLETAIEQLKHRRTHGWIDPEKASSDLGKAHRGERAIYSPTKSSSVSDLSGP